MPSLRICDDVLIDTLKVHSRRELTRLSLVSRQFKRLAEDCVPNIHWINTFVDTLATPEKWTDLGESLKCEDASRHFRVESVRLNLRTTTGEQSDFIAICRPLFSGCLVKLDGYFFDPFWQRRAEDFLASFDGICSQYCYGLDWATLFSVCSMRSCAHLCIELFRGNLTRELLTDWLWQQNGGARVLRLKASEEYSEQVKRTVQALKERFSDPASLVKFPAFKFTVVHEIPLYDEELRRLRKAKLDEMGFSPFRLEQNGNKLEFAHSVHNKNGIEIHHWEMRQFSIGGPMVDEPNEPSRRRPLVSIRCI